MTYTPLDSTGVVIIEFPFTTECMLTSGTFQFKSPSMDQWFDTNAVYPIQGGASTSRCGVIKTSGYAVTGISASSGTVNYTYYPSNGKLLLKAFYVDASTPLLSVLTVGFKTRRTDMDGFFMAGSAQETVTITMTLIRPITWTEPVPDPFLGPFYRMQEIE